MLNLMRIVTVGFCADLIIGQFESWWEHHGSQEYATKSLALLQWSLEPINGMPSYNEKAATYLRDNWMD